MEFNSIQPKDYTEKTFGYCIRERRIELGRSIRDVANCSGMSDAYLGDIEKSLRVAPLNTAKGKTLMENLIRELQIKDDEVDAFYAMAKVSSGKYPDLSLYLSKNPSARLALRLADESNLSNDEWAKFIEHIREITSSD